MADVARGTESHGVSSFVLDRLPFLRMIEPKGNGTSRIDLTALKDGLYFVEVQLNKSTVVKKILVTK